MLLPEKTLIARIRRQAKRSGVTLDGETGIGDDCAVTEIPRGHEALVTTDFSLENVHFRRAWHPPESVGHRCLTRGISDIAAMGGEPLAAFLSLALPRNLSQNWVDRFLSGLLKLAAEFKVSLAGGDTAESPGGASRPVTPSWTAWFAFQREEKARACGLPAPLLSRAKSRSGPLSAGSETGDSHD